MKNITAFLFLFITAFMLLTINTHALSEEDISSFYAVLMDAKTGQVLYDKNMSQRAYPASTTKIMTGLLVTENCSMNDYVTVSESALDIDEWNSSNIALSTGEKLPVDSAMYALFLPSANDAANVLSEHVAGTQQDFAQMMTQRAHAMGAFNTQFQNAHGLHDDNHYTTAYDMAVITRCAIQNQTFLKYFGTPAYTIPGTNHQPIERPFTNYQYMLVKETRFFDPSVIGGKVGYTTEAQHTMSTVAEKYGRTLICVVMKSPNRYDKFYDTEKLFQYGFEEFREISLPASRFSNVTVDMIGDENASGAVSFYSDSDFTALLHRDYNLDDITIDYAFPEYFGVGDTIPTSVNITIDPKKNTLPAFLGIQPLVADISLDIPSSAVPVSAPINTKPAATSPWIYLLYVFLGLFAGVMLLMLRRVYVLKKRHRQRIERLNRRIRENYRSAS